MSVCEQEGFFEAGIMPNVFVFSLSGGEYLNESHQCKLQSLRNTIYCKKKVVFGKKIACVFRGKPHLLNL